MIFVFPVFGLKDLLLSSNVYFILIRSKKKKTHFAQESHLTCWPKGPLWSCNQLVLRDIWNVVAQILRCRGASMRGFSLRLLAQGVQL
jgi:hypothetical protein